MEIEKNNVLHLTGDTGAVLTVGFCPSGACVASAGFGCRIYACTNFNVLDGHSNAITQLQWLDDQNIASCSADKSVQVYDTVRGRRTLKLSSHKSIVNCLSSPSSNIIVSGSDDCLINYSDIRNKSNNLAIRSQFPVLSVCSIDNQILFAGVDNSIHVVDIRNTASELSIPSITNCHTDLITCIAPSPDGTHFLSCSMDNSINIWNLTSFDLVDKFDGLNVNSIDRNLIRPGWSCNHFIACGCNDGLIRVFDLIPSSSSSRSSSTRSSSLAGHEGSVNQVCFSGICDASKNIVRIASAGSDGKVILGQI